MWATLRPRLRDFGALLALAVIYVGAARLGLAMDAVGGFATLVWPPSGIALAVLLRRGLGLWPGVFVGAFAVNLWTGAPALVALGMGTGNALAAIAGASALRRAGFSTALDRLRDVVALVAWAALGSTLVSSTVGVGSLWLGGMISADAIVETWRAWWIGDLIGDLVIAPLLLTWADARLRVPLPRRLGESLALGAGVVAVTLFAFGGEGGTGEPVRQPYMLFPLLIWAALRFGPRGVATTVTLGSAVAILQTAAGLGPFARETLHASLAPLQIYVAALALTSFTLAAVVAERRRAEDALGRALALASAVVEGTTDAVFVKDTARRYLMINRPGAVVLGRSVEDLIGKDDDAVLPPEVAAAIGARDREVLTSGESRAFEETIPVAGSPRTFLTVKGPYRDRKGKIVGLVGIARDITDRKSAERALEEAVGARDELLSVASHELRTPLSALALELDGLLRTISRGDLSSKEDVVTTRLQRASRQVVRLERLIENLLDVTRIGSRRLQLQRERFDLAALAREVVDRFGPEAERLGCPLALRAQLGATGEWDRLRVEQMITNLLSNATKYGRGRPIEVTVESQETTATIAVRDHGIGVTADDAARIFQPFERAASARHFGGLGLGLYITRQIAEAHGGSVTLDSEPDQGATFTITLPRAA